VLDSHEGSVGQRDRPCDQRNKLLGSQRAAGRTGGNQISPALRLNLMETHRGPARMPGLVIERGRLPTTLGPAFQHRRAAAWRSHSASTR
jgi:hypothetical protein